MNIEGHLYCGARPPAKTCETMGAFGADVTTETGK
jgi:hypothetical protein